MKFSRYSFTQLSMVLLAVTIMSVSVLGNSAYSDHVVGSGGTIDVVAAEGSNTISISGTTDRSDEVIVKVLAPNRNIVSIDQITPTGEGVRLGYSTTITTGGPLWSQDGDYSITIQQSGGNCTLVGGTSSDDREHDRDAKWSCSAGTAQGFAQFMENKYNHVVRVAITSGTTSETSVSIDYLVEHDEYYVSGQNTPTTKSMKKLMLTADGVQGSTTINVSGTTDKSDEVIIKVTAPNGNIVAIDQITPTGGSFATTIETSGALWSQDGTYTITVQQHAIDKQFSESKYNHLVRIGITSGTTSAASISIDNTVEHDEYYVDDKHIPTTESLKKYFNGVLIPMVVDEVGINGVYETDTARYKLYETWGPVVVMDEEEVPDDFKKVVMTESIDKKKARETLSKGAKIPGLHIEKVKRVKRS